MSRYLRRASWRQVVVAGLMLCLGLPRLWAAESHQITYPSGDTYVGEINANGQRQGQGTYTFRDGTTYVGTWQEDERQGQGTMTFPNGDTYVGGFANGKYYGQGTYTLHDGQKYVGSLAQRQTPGHGDHDHPECEWREVRGGVVR